MRISDWSSDVCSSDLAQVELSGRGRGGHDGAEPGFGLAMARERRSRLPFPAARLEVEKGVEPRIERVARTPAAERHRPLFGEAVGLTAQRSEEHTSELQSLMRISYAVFCLQKQTNTPYT